MGQRPDLSFSQAEGWDHLEAHMWMSVTATGASLAAPDVQRGWPQRKCSGNFCLVDREKTERFVACLCKCQVSVTEPDLSRLLSKSAQLKPT